jgi:hypothetical protein
MIHCSVVNSCTLGGEYVAAGLELDDVVASGLVLILPKFALDSVDRWAPKSRTDDAAAAPVSVYPSGRSGAPRDSRPIRRDNSEGT